MRVLITNTVALNGGDGAILESIAHVLRAHLGPDTEFVAHDAQPDVAPRYYPDIIFRPSIGPLLTRRVVRRGVLLQRRLRRELTLRATGGRSGPGRLLARVATPPELRAAVRDYTDSDLIVSTGGTYLVEHYDLEARIFTLEAALASGKPLVLYTQSLGPFRSPTNIQALRRVLPAASLVLLRDRLSQDHLREAGIDTTNTVVAPDVVFSMADPARLAAAARPTGMPTDRAPRVAISVREWKHFRDGSGDDGMRGYVEAVQAAVTQLVERYGAEVTFLSTCQGIPEYWTDDSALAVAIAESLPPAVRASVTVDRAFYPPRALQAKLATFDAVVTTRMHMAIIALTAGTPVLPIAYEFKTRELFEALGQGALVHDIEGIDAGRLVETVDHLFASLPAIRAALFPRVETARHDALASGALVRRAIGLAEGGRVAAPAAGRAAAATAR
jgi:colanic acid/amylovoran biosynthesis protein